MDYREIENLIKVLSDSKLTYLEIEKDGLFIKMGKESHISIPKDIPVEREQTSNKEVIVRDETLNVEEKLKLTEDISDQKKLNDEKLHSIDSPIVGTFYSSSTPGAEPFVRVGDRVKKGDLLCIIEAMKLMNEINSDIDGVIEEVLVKNEDMVQYGQSLFKIRK